MADSNLPKPLRSHDYIIDATGHLLERPPAPRYPSDPTLRARIIAAEKATERRELEDAAPPPKPVASVPVPAQEIRARQNGTTGHSPERTAVVSQRSRHDELTSQVAELVRQGKGASEAMDIVLDGEDNIPEPAPMPADWPPIPKHIQPYVDALLELRRRFEAQRADWGNALKLLKYRENTFDAENSDGGNFELKTWASIAEGYDVQYALDEREKALRTWSDGTSRIRFPRDTSPDQIRKLNCFREAYYTVKKPRSKKPPKPAASLPGGEVKEA